MAVDRGTYLECLGDYALHSLAEVVSFYGKPVSELSDDELLQLASHVTGSAASPLGSLQPRAAAKANRCAYCSRKHAAAAEMCASCGAPL